MPLKGEVKRERKIEREGWQEKESERMRGKKTDQYGWREIGCAEI